MAPVDQLKLYGGVPPRGFTMIAPVLLPKQSTLVCEAICATNRFGWVIKAVAVAVHWLASVTVTVYTPANSPLATGPLWPFDQANE